MEINNFLLSLRILPTLKGFYYLRDAIKLIIGEDLTFSKFKYDVYPRVAQKYNTNIANVERNISNAIDTAFLTAEVNVLSAEFGNTLRAEKGKPTCREFILLAVDKILYKYS
ncbi:MAG: sporulation initiation factor Spo0A C-terminal domain-containing protein [Clostridiales bacterium]|nr:sporulation initiation factor Spo0A C-terminal domain-containing protein [Clostridiales bacterium]